MKAQFSNRVRDVISYSREEALRLEHNYIGTEHLLLGIIREGKGKAVKALRDLGCDLDLLKKTIEEKVAKTAGIAVKGNIPLTKKAENVLKVTYLEVRLSNTDVIGTEHMLLSFLRTDDNIAARILQDDFSITYDAVRDALGFEPVDLEDTGIDLTSWLDPARAASRSTTFRFSEKPPSSSPLPIMREMKRSEHKIIVEIAGMNTSPSAGGAYALVLEEKEGHRRVPIIIGAFEAQAIALELEGIHSPRPMTHDLLQAFAESFGLTLVEVCIDTIVAGTFSSYLLVSSGDEEKLIDARPSDAVALAVRAKAPIYADASVLDEAGVSDEESEGTNGEE